MPAMAAFRFVVIEVMNCAIMIFRLREMDLNHRPPGYEPGTLPKGYPAVIPFICSPIWALYLESTRILHAQFAKVNPLLRIFPVL